ncbi:probable rRNA-processing protein EBP2 homolog [Neocloeon triangulifer]|uniref:probable rRNA-processing protein EBP2 homolog n=1 Tax=Neocloeon triangulifer TaxID=2078957 RepID=UPI00286F8659|nr:probable rRNA-processing protein EBP2 homolog [Neocloeon triangulifer]
MVTVKVLEDDQDLESESESEMSLGEEEEEDSETESDEEMLNLDSDSELQEAFEKGVLKPGTVLKDPKLAKPPKVNTNNVQGLKRKLDEFKLKEKWIERLDIVSGQAPLAPELAEKLENQQLITDKNELATSDFQRELYFYRQAQATVLEAIPRLKSMNIPTRRPEDYFAEMAKTDEHMQKVRANLTKKKTEEERREKVRNFRQQKKFGKKVEAEARVAKQMQKKAMLDEVRKFRKGQRKDLDFLDDDKPTKKKNENTPNEKGQGKSKIKRSQFRREAKDKKYGFGGRKRGKKTNTRDSASDVFNTGKPSGRPGGFKSKGKNQQQRPGKNRRQKMKGGRK